MQEKASKDLIAENQELRIQLEEALETLNAIRRGEVDGLVVSTPKGEQVYTITGAERPYRILIEEMKEGAVMLSDDNAILYCNAGFANIVKSYPEKLVGSNIENLISPTFKATFGQLLAECRGIEKPNSLTRGITFVSSDRSLVPTQVSINTLTLDNATTTFIVVTDLTRHMEEDLKSYTIDLEKAGIALFESEQRWATTLASIGDAVIATDIVGKVTYMNAVAEKLTGWSLKKASGMPVQAVFKIISEVTRKIVDDPVSKVLKHGQIVGLANHTILIRQDRTEVNIDDSGAPIKDRDGKTIGVVLIFRDITERRQMQQKLEVYTKNLEKLVVERTKELQSKERLAAIGATAGMVGHDIRNPLQAITGDLYLAREDLKEMPNTQRRKEIEEALTAIEENVHYINKIVSDLQDYTRPLKPVPEKVKIKDLITNVLSLTSIPKKIEAQVVADENFVFDVDPAYLRRALTNLIVNSFQAMPNGGKMTIKAEKRLERMEIRVEDTGVGIPETVKPSLFTPLFTTKAKGQGLGLAVVKRLIDVMNGTITFESKVGNGTAFIISLPQATQETSA